MKYSELEGQLITISRMISSISESTVFSFQDVLSAVRIVTVEMLRAKSIFISMPGYSFETCVRNLLFSAGIEKGEIHEV